jgi:SpoIIAA-like
MPFKLDIFPPDRIVIGVARGDITAADLADFLKQIIDANVLHYRKIIDITTATSSLGEQELQAMAERLRTVPVLKRRGALAIVVDHQRGELARLFMSMTSEERPVQVFRSIHEARKWLLANSKVEL